MQESGTPVVDHVAVVLDAVVHAKYAFYNSPASALAISSGAGLARGFVWMPVLDLLVRTVPKGHEAVGAALEWSPENVAVALSYLAGSWLYQHAGFSFPSLAWLDGGSTFVDPVCRAAPAGIRDGDAGRVRGRSRKTS